MTVEELQAQLERAAATIAALEQHQLPIAPSYRLLLEELERLAKQEDESHGS